MIAFVSLIQLPQPEATDNLCLTWLKESQPDSTANFICLDVILLHIHTYIHSRP